MDIITNKDLITKYVEKYEINNFFSFWDKYTIDLIRYNKNESISTKDNPLDRLLFLVHGHIKIYYVSSEGKIMSLNFKENFTLLGDMEFIGEKNCPCAEAITEVYCISISISKHKELLNQDLLFSKYLINNLAKKLNSLAQISFFNLAHSKENRLACYILTIESNGVVYENWTEASQLLSFSYRQLMRLLSKFCDYGLIKRIDKKGTYLIINKDKLSYLSSKISW